MKSTRRAFAIILSLMLLFTNGSLSALAEAVLTLPTALEIIDEEAFYGDTSIDKVVLPDNVKEIRARAFADSTLSEINLPDSLAFIAEDAFYGLGKLAIFANQGTYAFGWAIDNGYSVHINIDGCIYDAQNESGLSGASIVFKDEANERVITETTTDASGEFSLSLEPGKYVFYVTKNGYKSIQETITITSDTDWLEYYLENKYVSIEGTIYDAQDESGISGASIVFKDEANERVITETTTDASGEFSLSLESGKYIFYATKNGYKSIQETITITSDTDWLEYYLENKYVSINGTIYDAQDGSVLSGASIVFKDEANDRVITETTTDASGEFSLSLEPGKYVFYATKNGYKSIQETITITSDTDWLEYYLENKYVSIEGTIYDAQDESVLSGASIVFKDEANERVIAETTTNASGQFSLSLEPGKYVVYSIKNGYKSIQETVTITFDTDWLEYYLENKYVSIEGTIYDAQDGSVLSGVSIVFKDEANERVIAETTTNSSGEFSLSLELGKFVFYATKNGYKSIQETVMITYDADSLEYYMENKYVAMIGHVSAPLVGALKDVQIRLFDEQGSNIINETTTDGQGAFSISVEPGQYILKASKTGYLDEESMVMVFSEMEEISITMLRMLTSDEYRIRLTWDENPCDLDSHLVCFDDSGEQYHVYFSEQNAYDDNGLVCNLDVDDIDSYGPEVITLTPKEGSIYYYYIHHYAGEGTISTSGAHVEVFKGNDLIRTFNVPKLGSGLCWNVFSIVDGTIVGRNTISIVPFSDTDPNIPGENNDFGEEYARQLKNLYTHFELLYRGHKTFDGGYYDSEGVFHPPVDVSGITSEMTSQIYAQVFGCNANTKETRFTRAGVVAERIMDQLTKGIIPDQIPLSEIKTIMENVGYGEDAFNSFLFFADIKNATTIPLEKVTANVYKQWFDENEKVNMFEDIQLLSDLSDAFDIAKAMYECIYKYVRYTSVDQTKLNTIIEGLNRCSDSDIRLVAELLEDMGSKEECAIYLCATYGFKECEKLLIKEAKSSLIKALESVPMIGPFVMGMEIGAPIGTGINNLLMNIDELQSSAFKFEYSVEAAKAYLPVFMDAYSTFLDDPRSSSSYYAFKPVLKTFSELVAEEYEAYSKIPEAYDDSGWEKIKQLFGADDLSEHIELIKRLATFYRTDMLDAYAQFAEMLDGGGGSGGGGGR